MHSLKFKLPIQILRSTFPLKQRQLLLRKSMRKRKNKKSNTEIKGLLSKLKKPNFLILLVLIVSALVIGIPEGNFKTIAIVYIGFALCGLFIGIVIVILNKLFR